MDVEKKLSESWQRGGKSWRRRNFRESPPLLCALARWVWYLLLRLTFLDTNLAWGLLDRRLDEGRKAPRGQSHPPPPKILSFFPKRSLLSCPISFFLVQSKSCSPNIAGASSPGLQGNPRLSALLLRPSFLLQHTGERRAMSGQGPSTLSLASSADGAGAAGPAES